MRDRSGIGRCSQSPVGRLQGRDVVEYTKALSAFILDRSINNLPVDVADVTRRCILDWIGVTLGAVGQPSVEILKGAIGGEGASSDASIVGYGTRTTVMNAALINGTMAHALDYDDAHSGVRTHPSAPLVAAILPVAERAEKPGLDLMAAFVVGCEVTLRMGYALGRAYYERGWHSTAILGRFGAAAAVSRLLGLDAEQTSIALGLAATQAGGLRDSFGTMAKPFHSGKAAADGVLAAMLAQKGFTGPTDILEPTAGFGRVFTQEYAPEKLLTDLGTRFATTEVNFKPYAACLLVHPLIDALIGIKDSHGLDPASIKEVRASVAPFNIQVTDNPAPRNGLEGKFSLQMAGALALAYGRATERFFTDDTVRQPQLKALMAKIRVIPDPTLSETEAHVTATIQDGREVAIHVTTPKGDPKNPFTFDEIAEKARDLGGAVLSENALDRMVEIVRSLEDLDNSAELVRLCCGGARV